MNLHVFMEVIEREQRELDKKQREALQKGEVHGAAAYTGAMMAIVALSKAVIEAIK